MRKRKHAPPIDLTAPLLSLNRWVDPGDSGIWEPMSEYVEQFWLPVLGGTCLAVIRYGIRITEGDLIGPGMVRVSPRAIGMALGHYDNWLAAVGKQAPLNLSIRRAIDFKMARAIDDTTIEFRPLFRTLSTALVDRLSSYDADRHRWALKVAGVRP